MTPMVKKRAQGLECRVVDTGVMGCEMCDMGCKNTGCWIERVRIVDFGMRDYNSIGDCGHLHF